MTLDAVTIVTYYTKINIHVVAGYLQGLIQGSISPWYLTVYQARPFLVLVVVTVTVMVGNPYRIESTRVHNDHTDRT